MGRTGLGLLFPINVAKQVTVQYNAVYVEVPLPFGDVMRGNSGEERAVPVEAGAIQWVFRSGSADVSEVEVVPFS